MMKMFYVLLVTFFVFGFFSQAQAKNELSREWYVQQFGDCQYAEASLQEFSDSSCNPQKNHLCVMRAKCQKAGSSGVSMLEGFCLVAADKKCPADPLNCVTNNQFDLLGTDMVGNGNSADTSSKTGMPPEDNTYKGWQ